MLNGLRSGAYASKHLSFWDLVMTFLVMPGARISWSWSSNQVFWPPIEGFVSDRGVCPSVKESV